MHDLEGACVHLSCAVGPQIPRQSPTLAKAGSHLTGWPAMSSPTRLSITEHVPEGSSRHRLSPIVVLVHGSLDRSTSFVRVVRRLSDLHTVVYDRRGYHRSRRVLPLNTTLDGHVDDLLEVIGGRAAVVIGHSYGGDVALGAALRHQGSSLDCRRRRLRTPDALVEPEPVRA